MDPAPLGKRTLAFLIDLVFLTVVIVVIGRVLHKAGVPSEANLVLAMLVIPPVSFLVCWLIGNTPGKKFLNLHIVDWKTGETPSLFQFVRRSILFTLLVSFNILFVIPVLATTKRRGFHDMLAGTMVIEA